MEAATGALALMSFISKGNLLSVFQRVRQIQAGKQFEIKNIYKKTYERAILYFGEQKIAINAPFLRIKALLSQP